MSSLVQKTDSLHLAVKLSPNNNQVIGDLEAVDRGRGRCQFLSAGFKMGEVSEQWGPLPKFRIHIGFHWLCP